MVTMHNMCQPRIAHPFSPSLLAMILSVNAGGRPGREPISPLSPFSDEGVEIPLQRTPTFEEYLRLEELAFAFASSITSPLGDGTISLTELFDFMKHADNADPQHALENAPQLIAGPCIPTPAEPPAAEPDVEWVFEWMRSIFPDEPGLASEFARKFRNQGLASESDLKLGPHLTADVLKDTLDVQKLGHRRRIAAAHADLINI